MKYQINNKKASHVGIVISSLLFITFIIFMYILLDSQIGKEREKENALENVKIELLEKTSGEFTRVSVGLNNPGNNCVELNNFLSNMGLSNNILVRDDSENLLNVGIGTDLQIDRGGSGAAFFRIYNSEEFQDISGSIGSCQILDENGNPGYILGLSKTENIVFESKIISLLDNYTSDYETLKKNMNIGSLDNFGFAFTYSNGTQIKTPEVNVTISVYAESVAVQYIKTNGAREIGFIDAIVW